MTTTKKDPRQSGDVTEQAARLHGVADRVRTDVPVEIIVVGPFCWGRGDSIAEAKREAKRNAKRVGIKGNGARYTANLVPKGTNEKGEPLAYVNGLGGLCYRSDLPGFFLGEC